MVTKQTSNDVEIKQVINDLTEISKISTNK